MKKEEVFRYQAKWMLHADSLRCVLVMNNVERALLAFKASGECVASVYKAGFKMGRSALCACSGFKCGFGWQWPLNSVFMGKYFARASMWSHNHCSYITACACDSFSVDIYGLASVSVECALYPLQRLYRRVLESSIEGRQAKVNPKHISPRKMM